MEPDGELSSLQNFYLSVGGSRFFSEQRIQLVHLGDHRLSILLGYGTCDFDGGATMVGEVEVMEVSEGDIDSHRWLALHINQKNACFIEIVRQSKPSLHGDGSVTLFDPALKRLFAIGGKVGTIESR